MRFALHHHHPVQRPSHPRGVAGCPCPWTRPRWRRSTRRATARPRSARRTSSPLTEPFPLHRERAVGDRRHHAPYPPRVRPSRCATTAHQPLHYAPVGQKSIPRRSRLLQPARPRVRGQRHGRRPSTPPRSKVNPIEHRLVPADWVADRTTVGSTTRSTPMRRWSCWITAEIHTSSRIRRNGDGPHSTGVTWSCRRAPHSRGPRADGSIDGKPPACGGLWYNSDLVVRDYKRQVGAGHADRRQVREVNAATQ